jgi:hypothetical protein
MYLYQISGKLISDKKCTFIYMIARSLNNDEP